MKKEKPVSNIHFKMMVNIMSVVKNIRNIKKEIVRSGIKEGSHVLDYGCGPGFSTIPAAKIVGSQGMIYALDIHPLSVKIIEKKIKKHNLKNVKTILTGNGTGLPGESIDVVLLFNVIFSINDKEKLIDELHRVLKKGGVISIVNNGLGSKFKKKQVTDECLTEIFCKNNRFVLSEKTGNNLNFEKL
ncbi:MAG: class I SAM-dependent methyltransferase [Bacteroidota bacterium]|nr:class I SAM-dependent methyltransferase [Bacteroidota bacterium]